jgi:hypothetical protein
MSALLPEAEIDPGSLLVSVGAFMSPGPGEFCGHLIVFDMGISFPQRGNDGGAGRRAAIKISVLAIQRDPSTARFRPECVAPRPVRFAKHLSPAFTTSGP